MLVISFIRLVGCPRQRASIALFRTAQAIDAIAMSLAAVPVYMLARRVGLSSRLALAAAALSVTVPSFLYSGFISDDLFTSVAFRGTSSNDVFAFDDMTVGSQEQVITATPEPASLALMFTGFVGVGAQQLRRRRKQKAS